ncbi:MAG: hypothetical protein NXY57DRAFT_630212 [Lentinula lateritia]|nr:MAG: hypothetical protein NXY57DRAFT_630212 [Lentinula lateritia]
MGYPTVLSSVLRSLGFLVILALQNDFEWVADHIQHRFNGLTSDTGYIFLRLLVYTNTYHIVLALNTPILSMNWG